MKVSEMWELLKEQIEQRGPINFDNAMPAAKGIVARMEERGEEKEETVV